MMLNLHRMLLYPIWSTVRCKSGANIVIFHIYPGFFIDINLFKANKERAIEIGKISNMVEHSSSSASAKDGLADEDANLMIKLKFLTYKVSFLIQISMAIQSCSRCLMNKYVKLW